jgi:hypothetical protein
MSAAVLNTIAPVKCTSWCSDGTGHLDAEEPADQGCYAAARRVDLRPVGIPGQGTRTAGHIAVHLYRDAYSDGAGGALLEPPHIEIDGPSDTLRLSPTEALELSAVLAELGRAAQSQ